MHRLTIGEAIELKLFDQALSGETHAVEVGLRLERRLGVPVCPAVVHRIDGITVGESFELKLFDQTLSGESHTAQVAIGLVRSVPLPHRSVISRR